MVKHTPFMYKNVKKTFEILRSEITFLMDLYIMYQHLYVFFLDDVVSKNHMKIKSLSILLFGLLVLSFS